MRRLIIGIDPGGTSGVARFDTGNNAFAAYGCTQDETTDIVYHWMQEPDFDQRVVAIERFTQSNRGAMTRQNDALEIIGAVKFLVRIHPALLFVAGAAEAQRVGTRELLVRLGWWTRGVDHLNQAAAQAAYGYMRAAPSEFEQLTRM